MVKYGLKIICDANNDFKVSNKNLITYALLENLKNIIFGYTVFRHALLLCESPLLRSIFHLKFQLTIAQ